MDSQVKLHTDTSITIDRLAQTLDEAGIPSIVKNHTDSAIIAGFGSVSNNVDLFVYAPDVEKARGILETFSNSLEN